MEATPNHKQRKFKELTVKELAILRTNSKLSDKGKRALILNSYYSFRFRLTEIKICYEGFIEMCPTGQLDQKTFTSICKTFDPDTDEQICGNVFNRMDKNSDGTVDFSEYLFATAVTNFSGDLEQRLEFIFDFWDISEDGQLDQNELGRLISAMYDRARTKDRHGDNDPHKRAEEIIRKLDINHDKKISKEEFIQGCQRDEVVAKLLAPAL
ncbi:unnamed protein product [Adineta ricciae]|uniref:EF-hand domain-containing protein n=1 Tax=Adineta ricciae TaxID=249248 RepID=A0A815XLM2_ADIRI|nr:unnamed protein product [Adineta ricciae]